MNPTPTWRQAGARFILAFLLACLAPCAAAEKVYKTVDENGNLVFSDRPPRDGRPVEVLELGTPNTAPPPPDIAQPPPEEPEKATGPQYSVAITAPPDETQIPMGPGNFSVSATVEPALRSGHQLQLLLDGEPRQEPRRTATWQLTNVFRGAHKLTVAVIDEDREQLAVSEPVTVYVFRPSSNFRNRQ